MRRSPLFLSWTSLGQQSSTSAQVATNYSTEQSSRRLIRASGVKELPQWASSFSTRRLHSCAIHQKAKDDPFLRSMAVSLEGGAEGSDPNDSNLQVLLEWRAMNNRLSSDFSSDFSKTKVPLISQQPSPPPLPPPSISSNFFDSNSHAPIEEAKKVIMTDKNTVKSKRSSTKAALWITTLDSDTLLRGAQTFMRSVRAGERDVPTLADSFMMHVEWAQGDPRTAMDRTEHPMEAQLFFFSQWIAKMKIVLLEDDSKPSTVALCLEITADLYRSMRQASNKGEWISAPKLANLRAVQRATLHRLSSLIHPFTEFKYVKPTNLQIPIQSMTIAADIVSDCWLRPAQARYLCRKLLSQLRKAVLYKMESVESSKRCARMWEQAVKMMVTLIKSGTISPCDGYTSDGWSEVEVFLRLLCRAIGNNQVADPKTAILEVIHATQEANLKASLQKDGERLGKGNVDFLQLEKESRVDVFDLPAFVSLGTLEDMAMTLAESGQFWLMKELIFMAPQEQRSLRILAILMRKWSSVPPDFQPGGVMKRRGSQNMHSHRNCKISQQVWVEAMSLLDAQDSKYQQNLCNIFAARMASHARSITPGLVVADLQVLNKLLPLTKNKMEALVNLHPKAQVNSIRAFTRAGNLPKARAWAQQLLTAVNAKQEGEGKKKLQKEVGPRLLNVLLSAYFRLRLRYRIPARRRFALMIRRGGLIKAKAGRHLQSTINRYLRTKRNKMLPKRLTSSKNAKSQFEWAISFLQAFAIHHNIIPNAQTTVIILSALLKLSPSKISDEVLERIKWELDWDWKAKGVIDVLNEVKAVLAGGKTRTMYTLQSSGAQARRVALIDAIVDQRKRKREGNYHRMDTTGRTKVVRRPL